MASLVISTVPNGKGSAGTNLEVFPLGEAICIKPLGPLPKDGILIAADDARLLAVVLDAWTADTGPEGA